MISFLYAVLRSFLSGGEIPHRFGVAAILTVIYCLVGLILGLFSLKEQEGFRFFGILGIVLNGLVLFAIAFVLGMPA